MSREIDSPPWIAIEGVDAVGKSTIMKQLVTRLDDVRTETIGEFEGRKYGHLIRELVRRGDRFVTPVGAPFSELIADTLALIASDYEIAARNTSFGTELVVSERCQISRLVYQSVAIRQAAGPNRSCEWLEIIASLVERLPTPERIFVLFCPLETVDSRLQGRGEPPLTASDAKFLAAVQHQYDLLASNVHWGPSISWVDTSRPLDESVGEIESILRTESILRSRR